MTSTRTQNTAMDQQLELKIDASGEVTRTCTGGGFKLPSFALADDGVLNRSRRLRCGYRQFPG